MTASNNIDNTEFIFEEEFRFILKDNRVTLTALSECTHICRQTLHNDLNRAKATNMPVNEYWVDLLKKQYLSEEEFLKSRRKYKYVKSVA